MKLYNFNSGPAVLPAEVLQEASASVIDFNNIGLSVLEIGHRSEWFVNVMEEAKSLVKELMQLDDAYEVLYLQGGATMQFMQVPMNLLDDNETASYCDNGIWGSKAIKEAGLFGNVHVACSSKDENHTYIPKELSVPQHSKYLHYTTNNTVEGTQWHFIPEANVPLVADMSSDIFSREMPFSKFSLIYAGAQKNAGAAGVTIVVIKKDISGKVKRVIPSILDYRNHIEAKSLLNTPPVFAVYVSLLTLRWIKKEGGLKEMERRTNERADLFYETLDSLPAFEGKVVKQDRSLMNATFTTKDPELEKLFLDECKKNGMVGVKGHRSVGGLRVSMYNAMPLSSVHTLCDLMKDFSEKHS
ncbi:MAG TPA: 3-phosphoserine/phosphohydroxythreonine transaminase [Parafilimonas sp.]|nr:3-phosphoserine/phosphohydroxythreonine transaminase [Parafilimonas sp.]